MAARVATDSTSQVPSKVVPVDHQFGAEEQVKNSDQGNIVVTKNRARKNPMPASDLAKVAPSTKEDEKNAAVLKQIETSLTALQDGVRQYAKAVNVKLGDGDFNAWNSSILWLYTTFAEQQMNQNGKTMLGWESQQQVQNSVLQAAADAEKSNSNTVANARNPSVGGVAAFAGGAFVVGVALALIAIAFFATGGLAAVGVAAIVPAIVCGAVCAGAVGTGMYFGSQDRIDDEDKNNKTPGSDGLLTSDFMTETTGAPSMRLQQLISTLNQFFTAVSTKANNSISAGMQTNITNSSSQNTTLGQQVSQVIQAMQQMMQTPVGR